VSGVSILYDGRPLVDNPNSPAALHLLALLETTAGLDKTAAVALPGESRHGLPPAAQVYTLPNPSGSIFQWEQRLVPGLANRLGVDWVHSVGAGAALLGRQRALYSPAGWVAAPQLGGGLRRRVSQAMGQGGQARARWLWPEDLPAPPRPNRLFTPLPPTAPQCFYEEHGGCGPTRLDGLSLPQAYVLAHTPEDEVSLQAVLKAWTWVAPAMGEYYPLVMVGLSETGRRRFDHLVAAYQLSGTARPAPPLSLSSLAALYQGCSLLFHPGPTSVWGDPLYLGLAAGCPIVSGDTPAVASVVGQAAYLASATDARQLGAAVLSVLVEESLAEQLRAAARRRAQSWGGFDAAYLAVLES
jgi:hypothetical protein